MTCISKTQAKIILAWYYTISRNLFHIYLKYIIIIYIIEILFSIWNFYKHDKRIAIKPAANIIKMHASNNKKVTRHLKRLSSIICVTNSGLSSSLYTMCSLLNPREGLNDFGNCCFLIEKKNKCFIYFRVRTSNWYSIAITTVAYIIITCNTIWTILNNLI